MPSDSQLVSPPPSTAVAQPSGVGHLVVGAKRVVAEGVVEVVLAAADGHRLPDWASGAHIDVTFKNGITRQYSLCGDRWDARSYTIAVLREPNSRGGSLYVHDELKVGDVVGVGGPRNNFLLGPAEHYLFVAGGIGITPILAMIRDAEKLGATWTLLYGGRTAGSMAYRDRLEQSQGRVVVRPADEHGLLDVRAAIAEMPDGAMVYACGPESMLEAVTAAAEGLPTGRLRTERFVPRDMGAPVRDRPFDVILARTNRRVTVRPDVSVLDAITASGASILSSCREGTCGTCEVPVLDGEIDHRDSLLDDGERAAGTCMYPCVSRACTDLLVLDI